MISLLPSDLQIELGKMQHMEKFKRVKEEMKIVTHDLLMVDWDRYKNIRVCYYFGVPARNFRDPDRFYWYLTDYDNRKLRQHGQFVYGKGINEIKEYIKMNGRK
jgi:hypothetical protein